MRNGRRIATAVIGLLVCAALAAPMAQAAGTPDISAGVSSSSTLLGDPVHVTVSASNPGGQPYGYNLTFRVVLPVGVTYAGGASVAPTQVADQPASGQTTLIFSNVADLSPGSTQQLAFDVTPPQTRYDVGSSFTIAAEAYVNTNPRQVPGFTATGTAIGGTSTGSAGPVTGTQSIDAIEVTKGEPSEEGEILRGVHDHQTTYTLNVRNNGVNPTTGVTLDDYLPAGLEFLGCGGGTAADHTTDAPTNPGSRNEYPGSGLIDVPTVTGCVAPASVETVTVDPDGPGPRPSGVYTHVTWSLGTLSAHATSTISYRAAVPLRANTTTWTGAMPSPASGDQAANLDNNSGPEVTDETELTNYAKASGSYQGATPGPTSDDTTLTRTAEDWVVHKSASGGDLSQGALTTWTLRFRTGEYKYVDDATVTDTLPNGLCPLGSRNFTTGNDPANDAECDPVAGQDPSAPYASATENADGTWTLTWTPTEEPHLGHTGVNDDFTIAFPTRTRSHYQSSFLPAGPILARDTVDNSVDTSADGFARCTSPGTADCSTPGPKIFGSDGPSIPDAGQARQVAQTPAIDKKVAASGTDCQAASYVDTIPHYHPGDHVCWRLHIDFPGTVDTSTQAIRDFIPVGSTYDGNDAAVTPPNTVTASPVDSSGGTLSWTITGGTVPSGSLVFEHVFSTEVEPAGPVPDGEIVGNLMKFSSQNTPGESEPLRDDADIVLDAPELQLTKGVLQVVRGGSTVNGPNGPNTDNVPVQGGDQVTYRVDVTNAGHADAVSPHVWDLLPADYDCSAVTVSNGGTCTDGGVNVDRVSWTVSSLPQGASQVLTYTVTVPAGIGPDRSLVNHAGVRDYSSATNTGGTFTYFPAANIDTTVPAGSINAPAADDVSEVHTAAAGIVKSASTEVTESGNAGNQATIGEEITYTITATIPAGTTLHGTPTITDTVDSSTRQPYVTGSAHASLNGVEPLPAGWTLNENGTAPPSITLPADYTSAAGSDDDTVVLTFHTKVADVGTNTRSSGALTDTAHLNWDDAAAGGAQHRDSSQVNTTIVEPLLSQAKSHSPSQTSYDPGDTITYTVTTTNGPGAASRVSTAHDADIVDHVPVGLTPVDGSGTPLSDGATVPGSGGAVWHSGSRTIERTAATIAPGPANALSFSYAVKVDDPSVGGATKTNTVNSTTTSLASPQDIDGERTSGTGYAASASNTIAIGTATVAKTVDPTAATVGQPVTYTVDVTIPGGISLYDVTVVDTLPDDVDFDSYGAVECRSGCTPALTVQPYDPPGSSANKVAWDLGDVATPLPADQIVRLTFQGHIRSTHRGSGTPVTRGQTAVNSVVVASDQTDLKTFDPATIPSTFDNTSTPPATATTTVTEPHLTIDKKVKVDGGGFVDGPTSAQANSTFTYQLTITNSGDSPAYDATVTDTPDSELRVTPAGLLPPGVTVTDDWTAGDPDMAWHVDGPIPGNGGSVTLTYSAELVPASGLHETDTVDNTAAIPHYFGLADHTGPDARDYTDGGSDSTRVALDFPALTVVKTTGLPGNPDTGNAEVGQPFTWRIVVSNTSATATATDVHVADTLPANWVYDTGSTTLDGNPFGDPASAGADREWTLPSLAPGQSRTFAFTAHPTLAARGNPTNVNNARVSSARDEAGNTGNADGEYITPSDPASARLLTPDLTLEKTPDNGAATAGEPTTFTLTVGNNGSGTARNATVVDTLPAGLHYTAGTATASPSAGFHELTAAQCATGTVCFRIDTLAASGTVQITLPVAVDPSALDGTTLTNHASVTADEEPEPTSDDGSVNVAAEPDMAIDKTGAPSYTPGDQYTWHLRVRNLGPSDARSVVVTDPLPAGTTFRAADAPCAGSAGTVTCNLGTLAPGFDHTYDVTVDVASGTAASPLVNTATVTTPSDTDSTNDTDTFGPSPSPIADLSVTKVADPTAILHNHTTEFTLVAHNAGPSDAHGVQLVDTLPSGLTFVSADDPSCTETGGVVTCTLGDLASGADKTVHVVARGTANGTWTNVADVASPTEPAPDGDPNHAEADVIVGPVADLALTKTVPATTAAGGTATWTLSVTNHGPDDATGVTIVDPLPAGTSLVGADAGCSPAGVSVTCAVGNLANGATATRHVTLRVPIALAGTTVLNAAHVRGDQGDDHPESDDSRAGTQVGPSTDLAIVKRGPAEVGADGSVTWTLVATNGGPSTATGVTVVDTLPAGVELTSAQPSQGSCAPAAGGRLNCVLGTLTKGGAAQIQVVAHVPAGMKGATLHNVATIGGRQPDPVTSNNSGAATTAVGDPEATNFDLSIGKSVARGARPRLGMPLAYVIVVRNSGPATANGVRVVDTLPGSVKLLSTSGGRCSHRRAALTCKLGTLAPGASKTIRVRVRPLAGGRIRNTASVSASRADRDPSNDRAAVRTRVGVPRTSLRLSKTAGARHVRPGHRIRYRIVVRNASGHPAAAVRVCDRLPSALVYMRAPGARFRHGNACWDVGLLAPHAKRSFKLVARVTSGAHARSVRNVATVRASNARTRHDGAPVRIDAGGTLPGSQHRGPGVTG